MLIDSIVFYDILASQVVNGIKNEEKRMTSAASPPRRVGEREPPVPSTQNNRIRIDNVVGTPSFICLPSTVNSPCRPQQPTTCRKDQPMFTNSGAKSVNASS